MRVDSECILGSSPQIRPYTEYLKRRIYKEFWEMAFVAMVTVGNGSVEARSLGAQATRRRANRHPTVRAASVPPANFLLGRPLVSGILELPNRANTDWPRSPVAATRKHNFGKVIFAQNSFT